MCSFKWRGISYQAPPPLDNGLDDLHARNPHQIQQVYVVAAYRLIVHRLLIQRLNACLAALKDSEVQPHSADSRTSSQLSNATQSEIHKHPKHNNTNTRDR